MRLRTLLTRIALAVVGVAAATSVAGAQGTLGTQGFGYPPGQLSVFSRSVGGSTAEADPLSPINPAALGLLRRGGLYIQSEQERRTVDVEGSSGATTAYRFPLFSAALTFGSRWVVAGSFSTLLDRTWGTEFRGIVRFGDDSIGYVEKFRSEGALNDVRFASAWSVNDNLIIGAGVHLFPGENRLALSRVFDDSLSFAPLRDSSTVSYYGVGYSLGAVWRVNRNLGVSASGRIGGKLRLEEADTLRSEADVPSRFGAGAVYQIVPGTSVALRVDRALWSKMAGLGSERSDPEDSWDVGVGLDAIGPRVFSAQLALRGGYRRRTLPFLAAGEQVTENAFTLGTGAPIAGGRATADVFLEHATRSAGDVDAKERSWTLGFGLTVRP